MVLALAMECSALAQDQQDPVRIGVQAARGPEKCLERWTPTADYLTEQIPGRRFAIVPLDYDQVGSAAERGEVDFVLANPGLYATLEQRYGVSRLATLNNRPLRKAYTVYGGVIFCRAERADITTLADLKGKTFMGVDERAFGGWLAAWRGLKEHGIDPHRDFAKLSFGGTHDAVVCAVRDGKVDAGTVRTETLERMAMEGKVRLDDFRALAHDHSGQDPCYFPFLHSTETYPEWPLAKLARTPHELAETVAVALLSMSPDSPAAKAARCAGWTVPLNYQPVHECLKELRVGPYKDYGKVTFGDVLKYYWPWIALAVVLLTAMAVTIVWALRLLRQRKRAEEELRESEHKYRVLVENLPQKIFYKDRDSVYVSCNDSYGKDLGIKAEEIAGKTDYEFHPRELAERYRADDRRIMASGATEEIEEQYLRAGQEFTVQT
ncbi:MAG: PhnD/SsuA/transferrin family substrate-binding protein, partial [Planctomycetes bacterium]|nr:PhnD/SsuA/transferrin family substrate-binding protein [Planctomycetota bacterium]